MKKITAAVFVSILVIAQSWRSYSFEVETHKELSQQAVLSSSLDDFLKTQLNFPGGVDHSLAGRKIIDRISDGSVFEDAGLRFFNHFHNPLRSWNGAGLLGLSTSSIIWGQDPAQAFAWQNARDDYFNGLTASTQGEREDHLAGAFRALGQLIHLVQDAAQPAHTRNDPHPIAKGFEGYVENVRITDQVLFNSWINSSLGFDQTILTLLPNPSAPIPIARIIDTTDPAQTSASPSAGTNQGIAEYSNANFLSWDTIFKDFTFPRVESLGTPVDEIEPVTNKPRRYFPKVADGDTGYRLVAEGTFSETLESLLAGDQGYILDRGVFEDYGTKLLPRAIGYSAGLIDYFFRAIAEFNSNDEACQYNLTTDTLTEMDVFVVPFASVENAGEGQLIAVIEFPLPNPTSIIVSEPMQVNLSSNKLLGLNFNFSDGSLPENVSGVTYVVYKGPFGQEPEAVIGGPAIEEINGCFR
ncbi:MAG: hypothetical protein ACE5JU_23585 [Candidatus Binatia bacterium]